MQANIETSQEQGTNLPHHVAIVMDGNGRWAERQGKPRHAGHRAGVETVRTVLEVCGEVGVKVLTLFAFSSENWKRPATEVNLLMDLFITALDREVKRMQKRNIRLKVIGDISAFSQKLQDKIRAAEQATSSNSGLLLQVAANYGGRWDITQAARQLAHRVKLGLLQPEEIDEARISAALATHEVPDPDLFIRTGGEQRISNFLLWQCAYTEFYFSEVLWPDFSRAHMLEALEAYSSRQRRFGMTGQQAAKD